MNIADYAAVAGNPRSRCAHYSNMLPAFYAIVTDPYRRKWAESFHLPPFVGKQTLTEALHTQELGLVHAAGFRHGMHVIDIGCGIGEPTMTVAQASQARVTGVNIVPAHIEIAHKKAAERGLDHLADFVVADMMHLPYPAATFDGAFSFDAICHAPDKLAAYTEIARVLKPGAVFVGYDWLCADGLTAADYAEWIEPVCASSALPNIISLGELREHLATVGFEIAAAGNLTEQGDMTPNWDRLEHVAARANRPLTDERKILHDHASSTARAGRSGTFLIGHWRAYKV